ncbi:MAG: deoxyribose-phosphate aldolase [Patescibacteria group bacterium]
MKKDIAKIIDQTFLKKGAIIEDLQKVAQEAKEYGFRGFCVFPEHTKDAKKVLEGSGVKVITLVDEPTGSSSHEVRINTVKKAWSDGSDEVDAVMKIDDFKNKKYEEVLADLKEICGLGPTKIIIGSGYLTDEEIKKASQLVGEAGAICVKTATIDDPLDVSELQEKAKHVRIMKESVPGLLVKAAGSIRTLSDLEMMVASGADIIGTSSGVEIANEFLGQDNEATKDGRIVE